MYSIILFNLTSSDVCNSKNRTSSYISIQRMSKTHFLNVKSNYFSSFFSMGKPNTRLTVEYNSTFLEKQLQKKSNSKQPIKSQQELGKILTTQVKKKNNNSDFYVNYDAGNWKSIRALEKKSNLWYERIMIPSITLQFEICVSHHNLCSHSFLFSQNTKPA